MREVGEKEGKKKRMLQELGMDTCALVCIRQMTNGDLLYSTGNSTQYSVITYMGKDSKKD